VTFELPRRSEPFIEDSFPSFYIPDADVQKLEPFRVRVNGKNLANATQAITMSLGVQFSCDNVQHDSNGFSCALPYIPTDHLPEITRDTVVLNFTLLMSEPTAEGLYFTVQAIRDDNTIVQTVSVEEIHSGSRVVATLSKPLETAMALPWTPVLVDVMFNDVRHDAVFTNIQWDTIGRFVTFTVSCLTCRAGVYAVHIGEAAATAAMPHIRSDTYVPLLEQPCTFTGSVTPTTITDAALAAGATLVLPFDRGMAPLGTEMRVTADYGDGVPMNAAPVGAAGTDTGLLLLKPNAVISPNMLFFNVETLSHGRVIHKCTMRNALQVYKQDPATAALYTASRRVFFTGAAIPRTSVTLTGVHLGLVTSVRISARGTDKLGAECTDLVVTDTTLTCTFPSDQVSAGVVFAFVALAVGEQRVARVDGLFAVAAPLGKTDDHFTMGMETRVIVTLSAPLSVAAPLDVLLLNPGGAPVQANAQWLDDYTLLFTEAVFSASDDDGKAVIPGRVVVHEPSAPLDTAVTLAEFHVYEGFRPKPTIRGVYPSHIQLDSLDGVTPTVLHIDIDQYHLIEETAWVVSLGGVVVDKLLSTKGGLTFEVLFKKPAAWTYDLTVYTRTPGQQKLCELKDAFSIETGAVAPNVPTVYLRSYNYMSAVDANGVVMLRTALYNSIPGETTIQASRGEIAKVDFQQETDMTRYNVTMKRCAGGTHTCFDGGVTLTFTVAGRTGLVHASFLVTPPPPALARIWPATGSTLDFSTGVECIPYAMQLNEVTARLPLALVLPLNDVIRAVDVAVDERTRIMTGCLRCDGCTPGTYEAALAAPYTDYYTGCIPLFKTVYEVVTSPYPTGSTLALLVAPTAARGYKAPVPAGGNFLALTIVLSVVGVAVITLAGAAAVCRYRRIRAGKAQARTTPVMGALSCDDASEGAYTAL
jgi:hypothetical protein